MESVSVKKLDGETMLYVGFDKSRPAMVDLIQVAFVGAQWGNEEVPYRRINLPLTDYKELVEEGRLVDVSQSELMEYAMEKFGNIEHEIDELTKLENELNHKRYLESLEAHDAEDEDYSDMDDGWDEEDEDYVEEYEEYEEDVEEEVPNDTVANEDYDSNENQYIKETKENNLLSLEDKVVYIREAISELERREANLLEESHKLPMNTTEEKVYFFRFSNKIRTVHGKIQELKEYHEELESELNNPNSKEPIIRDLSFLMDALKSESR